MRNDQEKKLTENESNILQIKVQELFGKILHYDTLINRSQMTINDRLEELNKIWDNFRKAELVITDRLHGMIFCYITNTPCIAFLNNNHKIEATYQWILCNENISIMHSFTEKDIASLVAKKELKFKEYKPIPYLFQPLIDILKN